jgi:AcrR family transcriptional regulator
VAPGVLARRREFGYGSAMSWNKDNAGGRRGYHHGNLREALVRAALDLISQKGPGGFTFAEAARQAGVSPAAPYRHYRDRDALLADVATKGFEQFTAELRLAWDGGRPSPLTAFDRMGRAYLQFARAEPALYAAMFESGLPLKDYPDVCAASDAAFAALREACDAVVATLPAGKRPPALMMSLHIWSLCHGIASLFARGDGARRPLPMTAEELLESASLVYMQGLGFGTTD